MDVSVREKGWWALFQLILWWLFKMFACCFPSAKAVLTALSPVDVSGAVVSVVAVAAVETTATATAETNAIVTDIGVENAGEEPVDIDTLVTEKK